MKHKNLVYWIPPVMLMLVIFILSSQERVSVSDKYFINFMFFKSLHILEYGLLFLLVFRAIFKTTSYSFSKKLVLAFVITLVYAISDEMHQTFIPSREGRLRDVFIDTIGISIALCMVKCYKAKAIAYLEKEYGIFG